MFGFTVNTQKEIDKHQYLKEYNQPITISSSTYNELLECAQKWNLHKYTLYVYVTCSIFYMLTYLIEMIPRK